MTFRKGESARSIRTLIAVWGGLLALIVAANCWVVLSRSRLEDRVRESTEDKAVVSVEGRLSQTLRPVVDDLLVIAEAPEMQKLWRQNSPGTRAAVTELLSRWGRHKRDYYELRVLDPTGMEAVRINQRNGQVRVVPENALQDKSGRYFFLEGMKLAKGEVFVSPFDLNVDEGRIETPLHPTIRFCTPLFDEKNRKRGVLVFNYEGRTILEQVSAARLELLNSEGYWLKGSNPADEWGFLLEGRAHASFASRFPIEWARISTEETGQFYTHQGFFTFQTLYPFLEVNRSLRDTAARRLGSYKWKVVSYVPQSTIRKQHRQILWRILVYDLIVMLVLVPATWTTTMAQLQRAEARKQLRQQGLLLDLADDAVIVTDADGTITFWNSGSERKYGWSKPEALGRNVSDLLHTSLPLPRSEIVGRLERDRSWEGEVVHTSRDGQRIVNESRWSWQGGTGGEPVAILEINRDITERKKTLDSLRRSEESSRRLLATIPYSILVYDASTSQILEANDTATAVYGYKRAEFRSMKIEDLLPPEQLYKKRGHSARSPYTPLSSGDWKQRTKRGRTFDAEVTRHPFSFAGRPAVLVVVQDVTVRKQLEAELQHAQKLESIGQLAAGIAHEINTPMQFIGDNVQFCRDAFQQLRSLVATTLTIPAIQPKDTEATPPAAIPPEEIMYLLGEVPKALDQALEGTARVSTLVRAMKEFSHPSSKEKSLEDLHRAIDNTIEVARNEWKYVADVKTEYDNSLPPVPCLLGDLNQVVLNLIINAAHAVGDVFKATGRRGTITIRTKSLPEWAEIQVEDNGTGIPENARNRIFDPFFTTKEVGKGTGQGLAIARSVIVEKHKGTIQFTTVTGKGTTFTVRLPRAGSI